MIVRNIALMFFIAGPRGFGFLEDNNHCEQECRTSAQAVLARANF
jgi:hypothetical protein